MMTYFSRRKENDDIFFCRCVRTKVTEKY